MAVASQAIVEPIEEDKEEDEEVYVGEGSSTAYLVPKQVPALLATIPAVPGFWVVGPSDQVGRRGSLASSRAQYKAPAIQVELLPQTRQTKSCCAGSRWKNWQWRRLPRVEICPP